MEKLSSWGEPNQAAFFAYIQTHLLTLEPGELFPPQRTRLGAWLAGWGGFRDRW